MTRRTTIHAFVRLALGGVIVATCTAAASSVHLKIRSILIRQRQLQYTWGRLFTHSYRNEPRLSEHPEVESKTFPCPGCTFKICEEVYSTGAQITSHHVSEEHIGPIEWSKVLNRDCAYTSKMHICVAHANADTPDAHRTTRFPLALETLIFSRLRFQRELKM